MRASGRQEPWGRARAWIATGLLTLSGSAAARAQVPDAPGVAEAERFDPATLAPGDELLDAQVAQALWEARQGALAAALARLDAVLASPALADPARPRRERERLVALRAARDAWLATAAASGERIGFEHEGVRALARITGFEAGSVLLGRNRVGLEAIAADGLPIGDLMRQVKQLPEGTPSWVRPYALLLGGESGWDADLRVSDPDRQAALDADPDVRALRADAAGMESLLREGRAAAALSELSRLELERDGSLSEDDAERALARVQALRAELGDESLVVARRAALRQLAALALAARFDAGDVPPVLQGRVEPGAEGALRVSYAFERAEELDDFELVRGALPDWHASMTPVPKSAEDSYMIVRQGALFGDGQLLYRHALEFVAPVRVSYTMRYVPREGDPLDVGVVLVGLGWDGLGSFAGASEFGDVYATEAAVGRGQRVLFEGEREVGVNKLYRCEARLERRRDGLVVEAWRDGERRNELDAGGLERGGVFLFVHSPRIVAFEELVIEGRVTPASLAALRARWVERELAALGL
jgi:hypothetical protein